MAAPRHEYSLAERQMMVRSHRFFARMKRDGHFRGRRTNGLVAESMGCSPATVRRVMRAYRADARSISEARPSNRQRAYDVLEIAPTIEDFIVSRNRQGLPTTAQRVCEEVADLHDVVSVDTMTRLLQDLGYHHLRGEMRHMYADSAGNVAFRNEYLERKLANRVVVDGPHEPVMGVRRPEAYLDESYGNVNHVTNKTWLTSDKVRYGRTGKGPRVCIIGCGAIHTRGSVTMGGFLEESIQVWNSTLKPKDDDDYHGNFDTVQFERWFENLCIQLKAKYGACNIHMDGASYHKRQLNKSPTTSWRKAEIIQWFLGPDGPGLVFSPRATIPVLLELAAANRPTPIYMATTIATKYGHLIYYTPPYHPSLQPIELICGLVKGDIARDPAKNATELVEKVVAGLEWHNTAWLKCFHHAQGHEDRYVEAARRNAEQ